MSSATVAPRRAPAWASRPALLACIILAFALRIYRLDAQSFWYDEGNSARIAERSTQLILEGAAGDIHPPLYYLALKLWRDGAGETEFALRALSVAAAVLTVALVAALARRAGAGPAVAAFLAAIAPFSVYYSQEARMYALLALCACASSYALLRLASHWSAQMNPRPQADPPGSQHPTRNTVAAQWAGWAGMYAMATTAGLYTQYAFPFVMLAQGAWFLAWLFSQRGAREARARALAAYALLSAAAIAAFGPWVAIAIRQIRTWPSTSADAALGPAALDVARWLVVGRTLPLDAAWPALAGSAVLVIIGMLAKRRKVAALLVAWILVPVGLLFVFQLYRESYLKVLLMCSPPLLVLVARGVQVVSDLAQRLSTSLPRAAAAALCGLAAVALWAPLRNLYVDPAYARDDYRGISQLIQRDWRPTDAVLFSAANQWEVYTYYQRDDTSLFPLAYRPSTLAAARESLDRALVGRERIYVLYFGDREGDPQGWYEAELARRAYKADERWIGNIRLAVYGIGWDAPPAPTRCDVAPLATGAGMRLLQADHAGNAARRGDVVPVQLTLCAPSATPGRLKTFLHLSLAGSAPVAQNDAEPVGGLKPTDQWIAGEVVVDRRALWLPATTPPGTYGLYVGWYDATSGTRIEIGPGAPDGRLQIGTLQVLP